MSKQLQTNKGHGMEELLRSYFLKSGYYVMRGVPFVYEGFTVTDIDLWLYGRASSVSREIAIVDIKNKKTPQAIERIFWVQGLRQAVKATSSIVATMDRRREVKNFGRDLDVVVLDGAFLTKLAKSDDNPTLRLTEEEFFSSIGDYSLGKLDGDWRGKILFCKSLVASGLSFNSCNAWLPQAKFFVEQAAIKATQRETALRCFYLICSLIALGVDYSLKELSFLDQVQRCAQIRDGFTYGSMGSSGMARVLDVAMGLVEQHAADGTLVARQVRASVERELSSLNTLILGEYFSKADVAKSLFLVARELENLAMSRLFSSHSTASAETRSMLFCLLDYWGMSRTILSDAQQQPLTPVGPSE